MDFPEVRLSGSTWLTLGQIPRHSHGCDLITYFLVPSPQTLPYLPSSTVIQEKFPQLGWTPRAAPSAPGGTSIQVSSYLAAGPQFSLILCFLVPGASAFPPRGSLAT